MRNPDRTTVSLTDGNRSSNVLDASTETTSSTDYHEDKHQHVETAARPQRRGIQNRAVNATSSTSYPVQQLYRTSPSQSETRCSSCSCRWRRACRSHTSVVVVDVAEYRNDSRLCQQHFHHQHHYQPLPHGVNQHSSTQQSNDANEAACFHCARHRCRTRPLCAARRCCRPFHGTIALPRRRQSSRKGLM